MAKSDNLLLIFIKNPELGKVKTRLAKDIGDQKALAIYEKLLDHTNFVASMAECHKAVFYSSIVENYDIWNEVNFSKYLQEGSDLGERMLGAFDIGFAKGYKRVVVIGSDCWSLEEKHINNAFLALEVNDVVLGPAEDGGYYLLGTSKIIPELFVNKQWSSENVFLDTLIDIKNLGLKKEILETLSDIDTKDDLDKSGLKLE